MKIFISHSSKDKWVARRISEDLISRGAITFLDEKDLQTGISIDEAIKSNLKDCDDFLIIISPASLKSEWVLIELGGAFALEKRIIPLLIYVGANELPQVINLRLSRDINNIDEYYKEVDERIAGKSTTMKKKVAKPKKGAFKIGDTVKITSKVPRDVFKGDFLVDWESEMNNYLGKTAKIAKIYDDEIYFLEINNSIIGGGLLFAEEWLSKI